VILCKRLSRLLAVCVHSSSTLLVWEGRGEGRTVTFCANISAKSLPSASDFLRQEGLGSALDCCVWARRSLYRDETLQRTTTTRRETKPPS